MLSFVTHVVLGSQETCSRWVFPKLVLEMHTHWKATVYRHRFGKLCVIRLSSCSSFHQSLVQMLFLLFKAPLQLIVFLVSFFSQSAWMFYEIYTLQLKSSMMGESSMLVLFNWFLLPPQAHVSSCCRLFAVHTKPISSNSITNLFLPDPGIHLPFLCLKQFMWMYYIYKIICPGFVEISSFNCVELKEQTMPK